MAGAANLARVELTALATAQERSDFFFAIMEWVDPSTHHNAQMPRQRDAAAWDNTVVTHLTALQLSAARNIMKWLFQPSDGTANWMIQVMANRANLALFGTDGTDQADIDPIPEGAFRTLCENGLTWHMLTTVLPYTDATTNMKVAPKNLFMRNLVSSMDFAHTDRVMHLIPPVLLKMVCLWLQVRPDMFDTNPQTIADVAVGGGGAGTGMSRVVNFDKSYSAIKMQNFDNEIGTLAHTALVVGSVSQVFQLIMDKTPAGATAIDQGNAMLASLSQLHADKYYEVSTQWNAIKAGILGDNIKYKMLVEFIMGKLLGVSANEMPDLLKRTHQGNLLSKGMTVKEVIVRWENHSQFYDAALLPAVITRITDNGGYNEMAFVRNVRYEMRQNEHYKNHPTLHVDPANYNMFKAAFQHETAITVNKPIQEAPRLEPETHNQYLMAQLTSHNAGVEGRKTTFASGTKGSACECKSTDDLKVAVTKLVGAVTQMHGAVTDLAERTTENEKGMDIVKTSLQNLAGKVEPQYSRAIAAVGEGSRFNRGRNNTDTARRLYSKPTKSVERTKLAIAMVPEIWKVAVTSLLLANKRKMSDKCVLCPDPRREHNTDDCGFLFSQTKEGKEWRIKQKERFEKRGNTDSKAMMAALASAPCEECDPEEDFRQLFGDQVVDNGYMCLVDDIELDLLDPDNGEGMQSYTAWQAANNVDL